MSEQKEQVCEEAERIVFAEWCDENGFNSLRLTGGAFANQDIEEFFFVWLGAIQSMIARRSHHPAKQGEEG